jgi:uncharacterized protein (DUF1697 family)
MPHSCSTSIARRILGPGNRESRIVRYVALLRALNVGGKAVVKMSDVRAAFEAAGCRDVSTLGAAGNVLFTPGSTSPVAQQKKIVAELHTLMGAKTDVCFREFEQLVELVAFDPFGDLVSEESVKLYVTFMDRPPTPAPTLPIAIPKEGIEITGLRGTEMFVVSRPKPNGMYGFPNLFVEKLGVTATTRNWNTVTRLAAMAR